MEHITRSGDPPDNASAMAHVMLSAAQGLPRALVGPLVRLNPMIAPVYDLGQNVWKVPNGLDVTAFAQLARLGMDAVEADQVKLLCDLGAAWIKGDVPNQPILMHDDLRASSPSDATFPAAANRWNQFLTPPPSGA